MPLRNPANHPLVRSELTGEASIAERVTRRLAALERNRGGNRIRYVVSDRPPTEDEWHATKDGGAFPFDAPDELGPLLTEAEWVARFCF